MTWADFHKHQIEQSMSYLSFWFRCILECGNDRNNLFCSISCLCKLFWTLIPLLSLSAVRIETCHESAYGRILSTLKIFSFLLFQSHHFLLCCLILTVIVRAFNLKCFNYTTHSLWLSSNDFSNSSLNDSGTLFDQFDTFWYVLFGLIQA